MATKDYELVADATSLPTNKPGEPFTYKSYVKGDKVPLNEEQAQRLIEAGAVKDPDAKDEAQDPGAQTEAPKGKAQGVGDGDAEAGSVGDGGPTPAGTGTAGVADGGGPGDGQGNAAGNPAASTARTGRPSGGRKS